MEVASAVIFFSVMLASLERIYAAIDETRPPGLFPDDYNRHHPPWTQGKPAQVYLQLLVMDIDRIDDGDMLFSIQVQLNEFWKDPRLNLSSFKGEEEDLKSIFPTYLMKYIWVPDLVFENTKKGTMFSLTLPNQHLVVLEDGTFLRSSRYNMLVGCHMDFRLYPMDTQKCFLKIAALANSDRKVSLHWAEEYPTEELESIYYTNNIDPLKYELLQPESYKTTGKWTTGNFTFLYANFTFVRRVSGSLLNVYVPSTLVVFLSWISFWLETEAAPARVTLGVTTLLTLTTQIVQAHAGLPAISYMTAMDVWLFACLISVFCSLLEFAFSYQLHVLHKKQSTIHRENEDAKSMKPKVKLRILKSRVIEDSEFYHMRIDPKNSAASEKFSKRTSNPKSLDNISRKLFPFVFCVFSIAYWMNYLHKK